MIHSITILQFEDKIDFSLAGIYTAKIHANLSHEIISDLLFINRNRTALVRNTNIDVFRGSLDAVANIVDEMERNSDAFADTIDTE